MNNISPKYGPASLFFVVLVLGTLIFCLQMFKKYLEYKEFTAPGEIVLQIERSYIKNKDYAIESVIRARTKEFAGFKLSPSVEGAAEILRAKKEALNARKTAMQENKNQKFSKQLEEKLRRFDAQSNPPAAAKATGGAESGDKTAAGVGSAGGLRQKISEIHPAGTATDLAESGDKENQSREKSRDRFLNDAQNATGGADSGDKTAAVGGATGRVDATDAAADADEPADADEAAEISAELLRKLARFDELAARTLLALSPRKLSAKEGFRVLKLRHHSAVFYASVPLFAPAPPPSQRALLAPSGALTQVLPAALSAQKLAAKSAADAELIDEFAGAKFARVRLKTRPSFLAYLCSHALLDADILAPADSHQLAAPVPAAAATSLAQEASDALFERIAAQHASAKMREFFGALFLAKPYGTELRRDVNFLGVAHLLAISGYHLGLIYACLFWLLLRVLKPLRPRALRHFPAQLICAVFAFLALAGYFALIGLVPSFFRAFCMAVFAFVAVLFGLRLRSLLVLLAALAICLLAEPALAFELGFFFSALGVFYIFLFAEHFSPQRTYIRGKFRAPDGGFLQRHRWAFWAFFEAFVFFSMVIPVLAFFPLVSMQQLFALVLTPLFVLFYPLSLVLHLLGAGGLFDGALEQLLALRLPSVNLFIPMSALLIYLALSVFALRFGALIWPILAANLAVFALQFAL